MKRSTYNLMKKIPGLSGIADAMIGSRLIKWELLKGTKAEYLARVFAKMHNDHIITSKQYYELFDKFNACKFGVNLGDPMDEAFKEIAKKFFKK